MSHDEAYRIALLVAGHIRGTLTDLQKDELDEWLTAGDSNMELFAELTDEQNIEAALTERRYYDNEKAIAKLKDKILHEKPTARRTKGWVTYAVAAAVGILLGIFFIMKYTNPVVPSVDSVTQADLLPGSDKAVLTVAGGKQITLDGAVTGTVYSDKGMQVSGTGAMLEYSGTASSPQWHILTTPRGGQYKLRLPDGSLVWLNAESSIRFPTVFMGNVRRVLVTGEAYFEVAKDPAKKFIVTAGHTATTVLGTHFNISAYGGDSLLLVTLAEGKVSVTDTLSNKTLVLAPGEQVARHPNNFSLNKTPDLDAVLAWKNGWFDFREAPIEQIMQQVGRWYNVEVVYKGKIDYHFNAEIERSVTMSKLLQLLEKTGRVHFDIHDRTIIVKP